MKLTMKNKLLKKLHSFWKHGSNMDLIMEFLEKDIINALLKIEILESVETETKFKLAYLPEKNYLTKCIFDLFLKPTNINFDFWVNEIEYYKDEIVDKKVLSKNDLINYYIEPAILTICDSWDMKYELELNREND